MPYIQKHKKTGTSQVFLFWFPFCRFPFLDNFLLTSFLPCQTDHYETIMAKVSSLFPLEQTYYQSLLQR